MGNNPLTGKIFDIQGFSVQDGPGIRTTVFLKGCPLRCPWCHSPESRRFETELNWLSLRCIGMDACGYCLGVCPRGCISRGDPSRSVSGEEIVYPEVDKANCDECGKCASACKATALYMCGSDMTVDDVLGKIRRDMPFYETSGGGVTISGGECLAQPEFTGELLKQCKALGVHTAVDTTGFVQWRILEGVLPYTDLFLYDLKCMDSGFHERTIGVPNGLILENALKLAGAGALMWVRIPVLPMFNDSEEHFRRYVEFLSGIRERVAMVQLLPYHKLGISKYARLLTKEQVFVTEPPTDDLMEARKQLFETSGFTVRVH